MGELTLVRALLLAAVLALVAAAPAAAEPIEPGDPTPCLEAIPAAISPPLAGEPIELRVLVLYSGIGIGEAVGAMEAAARAYAPLNIRVVPAYRPAAFMGSEPRAFIDESKALLGGGRPAGVDLVYALVGGSGPTLENPNFVAGQADCIGGVAHPDRAFAAGWYLDYGRTVGPVRVVPDVPGKIAAHELGHLMGAHHHYANCAEGVSADDVTEPASPCTLMFNSIEPISLAFSTLNAAVVRGHAEAFLPGEPHVPPPPADGTEPQPPPQDEPQPQQQPQQQPQPGPSGAQPAPQAKKTTPKRSRQSRACRNAKRRLRAARKARPRHPAAVKRAKRAERRACRG